MKLYGADGKELMMITAIERDGSELMVKGKIFGTMPLTARMKPSEFRKGLGLMSWRTLWFAFTLPFRRG
jgi:hypothetical protein